MEFKGTPAPWVTLPEECDRPYIRVRGTVLGGRYKVANVLTPNHEGVDPREAKETRANAHLIAAAPELLEALRELIQSHEYSIRIGHERIIELGGDCDSPEIMITKDSSLNKAKAAIAKALGQQ